MKPAELLTTLWNVCSVGRLISALCCPIHSCRTASKLLANTTRRLPNRAWNTGPRLLLHAVARCACESPSCSRLPSIGTPRGCGRFLIWGMSVLSSTQYST